MAYDAFYPGREWLDTDGNLEIEGMDSSFVCGVTREMTGNSEALYPCECKVLSAKVKL